MHVLNVLVKAKNNKLLKKSLTLFGSVLVVGTISVSALAMDLTMPETSSDGNFAITWVDAKGGTGFADVTIEEKIGDKFESIYSYTNGPSANTHRIKGKAPGTYVYRITECVEPDNCSAPIEKTIVVTAAPAP